MHGVFPCPESCHPAILSPLFLVEATNARLHTHVYIGVSQQALNADQDLGNSESQAPVVVDRVQTHVAVTTDIGVKYLGNKSDNWWPHRVATKKRLLLYQKIYIKERITHCKLFNIGCYLILEIVSSGH